jgi:conjugative transposon TraK protein
MLLKNLENKIKLALFVSCASFLTSIIIVLIVMINANNLVKDERKNVYVLDGGLPLLVQRASLEENEEVEAMSHINIFHSLFFNLPPDDKFIADNIYKAMYLIDESGLKFYNDMREKGFYNQLIANSMLLSTKADSIHFDTQTKKFIYYGTQRIERPSTIVKRSLISEGYVRKVSRSQNNPHGFIIFQYQVIKNDDIEIRQKRAL